MWLRDSLANISRNGVYIELVVNYLDHVGVDGVPSLVWHLTEGA